MADHELVRETMVSLGEGMQDCGYDAVLETIEGTGVVARAVRNPRDNEQLRVIILYLKDLAKTVRAEAPSPGRDAALAMLVEAWETIRAAVHEEDEESEEDIQRHKQRDARAVDQRRMQQMQASRGPAPRALPGQVMVAPAPQQRRPQPQQRRPQTQQRALPAPKPKPAQSVGNGGHYVVRR